MMSAPMRARLVLVVLAAIVVACTQSSGPPEMIPEQDLVPPDRLAEALKPVDGWSRAVPSSQRTTGEMAMTTAKANYLNTTTGQNIEVSVMDSGLFARAYANLTRRGYKETTGDSEAQAIEVNDMPAVQNWNTSSHEGTIGLLVGNRFVVSIVGKGLKDLTPVRDFATHFDPSALVSLRDYRSR
jgi:hypothetical protein